MVEGPVTNRRFSRRATRRAWLLTISCLIGIIAVAGGWYVIIQLTEDAREATRQEQIDRVQNLAGRVAAPFTAIAGQLQQLARRDRIITLFTAGDRDRLAATAEDLTAEFDPSLKLRFFLPGQHELEPEASPPLSYASLDLLKTAENTSGEIGADVHMFGAPEEHIVMVQRVTDDTGKLVGVIHLSLDVSLFQQSLSTLSVNDSYLEIHQGAGSNPLILARTGDPSERNGEPLTAAVTGTRWTLAYWPAGSGASVSQGELPLLPITGGLLLLLIAVLVFLLRRRGTGNKPVEHDSLSYSGAIEAIMQGAHPGMEKLIPHLPGQVGNKLPAREISRGMEGEDITRIPTPRDAPQADTDATAQDPDIFDITAAAGADVFDITTGDAPGADDAAADETEEQKQEEGEQPLELSRKIFRTYDIRGVAGRELTAASVARIGQAIGSEAAARGESGIVIGRDGRNSGPELSAALIEGLRASGCNVIDIGIVPTPVLYFATHFLEPNSGVILTGSHNPPEYNGLKIVLAGETLSEEAIQTIYHRVVNNDLEQGSGELQTTDINAEYIRRISEDIPAALGRSFRIVVDCGNGVTGNLAPQLYRALGHDVIELYCEIDGNFPNHHPDPSQPDNMQDLIERVKAENADLGFAFDGDGDRLGVVDSQGNIIWPDRQLMLLAKDILTRNPGAEIIYDVKCSRHLKAVIEAAGGVPQMWKTGHSLIKGRMKESGALLAGEMSGHIFFRERWYGFDDALYTGARMLEVLLQEDRKPDEIFAALPGGIATPELRVDLPEEEHQGFMEEMQENIHFDEETDVITIDGLRIEFVDGWGLVRPSNTTPCLVLRFEADNQAALERIQNQFRGLMQSIIPGLDLPF